MWGFLIKWLNIRTLLKIIVQQNQYVFEDFILSKGILSLSHIKFFDFTYSKLEY